MVAIGGDRDNLLQQLRAWSGYSHRHEDVWHLLTAPSRIAHQTRLSNNPDPAARHRLRSRRFAGNPEALRLAERREIKMRATADCDYYGSADMHKTIPS